ncbi:MAG TPA: hypothetical protein VKV26_20325 [Dehalococcoidia bacterium]|nr:hypothetical protein [Dehalococcoidia bacterium]
MSDVVRTVSNLHTIVVAAHTTTHLPPDRAVITTPALVALMERCIAKSEQRLERHDGRWLSIAADINHRAGLKQGEYIHLRAQRSPGMPGDREQWHVTATADADGRLIAEGTIERAWEAVCPA